MISGVVAQMLARNPGLTPDQVKGGLMRRARAVPLAEANSCGVGQVNAVRSVYNTNWTSNPNAGLNRFLSTDPLTGGKVFNAVSWTDVSWSDVSWDAVSWTDVSWSDVSWDAVSWSDVSWTDVSWTDVSWSDVSWEDAGNDAGTPDGSGCPLDARAGARGGGGSGPRSAVTLDEGPAGPAGPSSLSPRVTLSGELERGYPDRGMPVRKCGNTFRDGHSRLRFAASKEISGMKSTCGAAG